MESRDTMYVTDFKRVLILFKFVSDGINLRKLEAIKNKN